MPLKYTSLILVFAINLLAFNVTAGETTGIKESSSGESKPGFQILNDYRHRGGSPQGTIGARLPHLKIDIIVKSAYTTESALIPYYGDALAFFELSGGASVDVEDSADFFIDYILLPGSEETENYNRTIYSGVVFNGCSSSTVIQLRGRAHARATPALGGSTHASAELFDSTVGYGFYDLKIFLLGESVGDVEYVISGDVSVYCTNSTSPSAI